MLRVCMLRRVLSQCFGSVLCVGPPVNDDRHQEAAQRQCLLTYTLISAEDVSLMYQLGKCNYHQFSRCLSAYLANSEEGYPSVTLHGPEVLVVWKTTEREGDHVKNEPSHKLQRTAWTLARLQQCCEWHSRLQTDLLPRIATPERGSEEQNLHACRCHDIVHPEWVNMNRGIQRVSCETEKRGPCGPPLSYLFTSSIHQPNRRHKTQDTGMRGAHQVRTRLSSRVQTRRAQSLITFDGWSGSATSTSIPSHQHLR